MGVSKTTRKLRGRRSGFTLIELLVVVVIIGILASVAMPSFSAAQDKARNAAVQSNIKTVQLALEQYAADNKGSYPVGYQTDGHVIDASDSVVLGASLDALPGKAIPRSPWAPRGFEQYQFGGTISVGNGVNNGSGLVTAASVANGTALTKLGQAMSGSGVVPDDIMGAGTRLRYGAILYGYDSASTTYVLYGCGKNRNQSVIVAAKSNQGQ